MKNRTKIIISIILIAIGLILSSQVNKYQNYKSEFTTTYGINTWELANQEAGIKTEIGSFIHFTLHNDSINPDDNINDSYLEKGNKSIIFCDGTLTLYKDKQDMEGTQFKKVSDNMYTLNGVNVYIDAESNYYSTFKNNMHMEYKNIYQMYNNLLELV